MAERQVIPRVTFSEFNRNSPFRVRIDRPRLGQFMAQELGMDRTQISDLTIRISNNKVKDEETGELTAGLALPLQEKSKHLTLIFIGSLTTIAADYANNLLNNKSPEGLRI